MSILELLTRADADLGPLGVGDGSYVNLGAKFDNRPSWDNRGKGFDNRPTWDNWTKRGK
ncbi:multiple cyclophane-containing RiPP AmcA [Polymorphospora rubra]|uniref:Uncharacterized protein n=1 Tax=Polymorphospora rubra TaxID=338584 RepID=A0A810MW32_9ACTN|nr:hypothetical protein Prubr_06560 [Polymorphospora rubra]